MPKYVALLRGITPSNPNMRNEKLRGVCEDLGLQNVQTVISSGNVVFESDATDRADLETTLEKAWLDRLGFESTTIVRSQQELEGLVETEPFGDRDHSPETYLLTTFAKHQLEYDFAFPFQPEGRDYWLVGGTDTEVFSVTDTVRTKTPDVMNWLEERFGKKISSRTWLTVQRVLKRMR